MKSCYHIQGTVPTISQFFLIHCDDQHLIQYNKKVTPASIFLCKSSKTSVVIAIADFVGHEIISNQCKKYSAQPIREPNHTE